MSRRHILAAAIGHTIIAKDNGLFCGCGGPGHWEAYCGGANIERRFKIVPSRLVGSSLLTVLEDMATGIRNLSATYPGMPVVMGGSIALMLLGTDDQLGWLQEIVNALRSTAPSPELRLAHHGNDSCIEGALIAARSLNA